MTNLVEWNDSLSVGIQEIDEQHKVLVDLLNEMNRAIINRQGTQVTGAILQRLAHYTKVHFAVEESLMRILGYPDYEAHKARHDTLIDQMNELQTKLASGKPSTTFELMHFLKVWLTKHIQESDNEYSDFFFSRGVQKEWEKKSWLNRFLPSFGM